MQDKELISIDEFCTSHHLEFAFIESLQQYGLIEVTTVQQTSFVHDSELSKLEQFARLYHELEINLEGIGAITHLLDRINEMHQEIVKLRNKLSMYEPE